MFAPHGPLGLSICDVMSDQMRARRLPTVVLRDKLATFADNPDSVVIQKDITHSSYFRLSLLRIG